MEKYFLVQSDLSLLEMSDWDSRSVAHTVIFKNTNI